MAERPLSILLIEDSADDAELLALELRRGGLAAEIGRVETPEAMEEALRSGHWDAVISDFSLPHFSAPRALEVLRRSGRDLPFLVISGVIRAGDAVTLLKAGAHDFVEKSDLARLVPAIERELREAEVRRARARAEDTLRKLSQAVNQLQTAVIFTDRSGSIEFVNPRFLEMYGFDAGAVIGQTPALLKSGNTRPEEYRAMWETILSGREWRGEFLNRTRDGRLIWVYATIAQIRAADGTITHFMALQEDITQRKDVEEKLYRQENFDPLTQLPRRTLMFDRLSEALRRARPERAATALFLADLDNFKDINETLGHGAGDQVLQVAARRLEEAVGDRGTVGRLGDDEFAILVPVMAEDGLEGVAGAVLEAFRAPMRIDGHDIVVTLSLGITLCPADGREPGVLLRNAEAAMRRAKQDGRDTFRFFAQSQGEETRARVDLVARLRAAIAHGDLELHYQPILEIATGRPVALEALLRWNDPALGPVPPERIVRLAEGSGLIGPLGEWVLEAACRGARALTPAGWPDIRVAVNVSPRQLRQGGFDRVVVEALARSGIKPAGLEIEIIESALLEDSDEARDSLERLVDLGVRLSLDDFGTGYSSLSYLRRYRFNTLKIDKSFLGDVHGADDESALIDAIIAMAHSLGLDVVAEGVEAEAQLDFLWRRGCDLAQGYLMSRPAPLPDVLSWLNRTPPILPGLPIRPGPGASARH